MATHRYMVCDLVTDRLVGWVPLGGVSYGRRISTKGDLQASFTITAQTAETARFITQRPAALYAVRETKGGRRDMWWGGIIWTATPGRSSRGPTTCEVQAATFESLPAYRKIWADTTYEEQDRGVVLRDLWDRMQSDGATAQANVETGAETIGGDPYTGTWLAADTAWYADAITTLTTTDPAFEFTIDIYQDPTTGARHRKLRIGTPHLGNPDAHHLLARPSSLTEWSTAADHTIRGTHALARGAAVAKNVGGDTVPITSPVAVSATALALGYPRVDVQVDYDTISDEALLPAKAVTLLVDGELEPAVTVSLPDDSGFSPGNIGDTARLLIVNPFFDTGSYDVVRRVIGVTVTPAERGRPETATLEFQPLDSQDQS